MQYADQQVAVGRAVNDEDMINYIVNGLHLFYTPFITSLSLATQDHLMSFE